MYDVHLQIVVFTLDGVLRLVMQVELLNFEFVRSIDHFGTVLGPEKHSLSGLVSCVLVNLDSGVSSNPISWSVIEIAVRTFDDILLNIDLRERVLKINW